MGRKGRGRGRGARRGGKATKGNEANESFNITTPPSTPVARHRQEINKGKRGIDQSGTSALAVSEHLSSPSGITPAYAFTPQPNDVLVEMFLLTGGCCLKCSKKVPSGDMVLCTCGHFVCKNCFVTGCFCFKQGQNADKQEGGGSEGQLNVADYECDATKSTSAEVNLEGVIFLLDCVFFNRRVKPRSRRK